ncbi:MAG TPA: hypothetical protein VLA16_09355 [Ideonella sp.]|nr:hypothetical protein [Ideonella sp.]
MNPNIDKGDHVLNIDDADNRPDLAAVAATADFYALDAKRAAEVLEEVAAAIDPWREVARRAAIANADIELTSAAFAAHTAWRSGSGPAAAPAPAPRGRRRSPGRPPPAAT